jgi:hypothetical protein
VQENLRIWNFFCNFAIVIEITIATIGCGSEKPEQAQFSLALHDGCNVKKAVSGWPKYSVA